MSVEMLSPETTQALELPRLLALIAELAATDLGRRRVEELTPAVEPEDLAGRRARFEEARRLVADRPLVPALEGSIGELLARLYRLDTGRPAVTGGDLVRLAGFLRAAREAKQRVADGGEPGYPALADWLAPLPDLSHLTARIGQVLDRRGDVREDASPELATFRGRIRSVRGRLYEEMTTYVTQHRETLAEETIPMRGGRLVLMLPSGSKGRLAGLTHGRSGSGKSFYFEPLEMVETNNSLQQAVEDEEAERQRLIAELLALVQSAEAEIEETARRVAELDLLQAAVRFAQRAGARLPELPRRQEMILKGARHPLLDPALADLRQAALGHPGHRSPVVPLDLTLSTERRVLVITGPNAGGKTVALKTAGLLAAAAQCGLPIPAEDGTSVPFFEALVATVGDEQDLLTDRSTFSGRLLRLKEAWDAAGPRTLLLLDELGSGTDPEEGSALSVALLESLLARGSLGVITTHLTQLAASALESDGAGCAAMEFDAATGGPTYRLLPGPPGGSEALALARRLGLPAEWLDRAEARLGSEHRQLRKLLAEVERIRRELGEELDRVEREADDAAKLRERLTEQERAFADERRSLAKNLRTELDVFRRETRDRLRDEVERLRREYEKRSPGRGLAEAATSRLFEKAPEIEAPEPEPAGPLTVGGQVRHRGLGWEGVLERVDGHRAEVSVRGKRVRLATDELMPVAAGKSARPKVSMSLAGDGAPDVPRELHLIGQRVEPALERLDRYLDQALLSTLAEVRVVHGHGSGRLRGAVRDHLRGHPAVASQRPGKDDEGGNGATVVALRR